MKIEKGIYQDEATGSYLVNSGQMKVRAFPTLEDARKYRDEINAERLRVKIEQDKAILRQKEDAIIAKSNPYPFNLIDALVVKGVTEDEVEQATKTLPERELAVLLLYYQDGLSMEEIGSKYGVTRERIRQVLSKAVRRVASKARLYPKERELLLKREIAERDLANLDKHRAELVEIFRKTGNYSEEMEATFGSVTLTAGMTDYDLRSIEELDISIRSYNCLKRAGVCTFADLTKRTLDELSKVRNLGKRCLKEIVNAMKSEGLTLIGGFGDE